jgi:hypothetical protein
MRSSILRSMLGASLGIALVAGTAIAQDTSQDTSTSALAPNQTAAFGASMPLVFTYTENFDCVDAAKDDLNFNGILAESDPLEFQTPICQVGKEPKHDPTGALATTTDKLWVLVPFFGTDTTDTDAIACPANARPGLLCGKALGDTLISLFGIVPEGFKQMPSVPVQCPDPGSSPGNCTMHASTLDLFPVLVALGKLPATPQQNVFVPTPNHSHVINKDLFQKAPQWWQVITVLVTDPADWPTADGKSGITGIVKLRKAQKAGGALEDVPSNFYLFFGSMKGMKM